MVAKKKSSQKAKERFLRMVFGRPKVGGMSRCRRQILSGLVSKRQGGVVRWVKNIPTMRPRSAMPGERRKEKSRLNGGEDMGRETECECETCYRVSPTGPVPGAKNIPSVGYVPENAPRDRQTKGGGEKEFLIRALGPCLEPLPEPGQG